MANQKQFDILKQGVEVWNAWRKQYPDVDPNLSRADFNGANLSEVNLSYTDLSYAKLNGTNLSRANLSGVNIKGASLSGASLIKVNLSGAGLRGADLSSADLSGADLSDADLRRAYLTDANLSGTDLSDADLSDADLSGTNLNGARVGWTIFGDCDLRIVRGLETIQHEGPSPLSINTIYRSEGNIPETFLQGVGIPNSFIDYMRSLVSKLFDYYTCFISYSSKDQAFAERLYIDLQSKGVRCWFAPKDIKIGDKIRPRIDEAILIHDKLLLVLSEHAIESDWVEKEVETAFEKERLAKERGEERTVLFPIRLDDTVMHTAQAWAADIRRVRHIGDFSQWKNHDHYQKALSQLLRDLKAETRKAHP